jgi:aminopeptidase N
LYVARHDNQAVTCDDFRRAMADANGRDLEDFVGWYSQAGTPHVTAHGQYDRMSDTYTLTLKQTTAPTPGQPNKRPLPIPLAIGLVGPDGTDIPLVGEHGTPLSRPVITLTEAMQSFVFTHVPFAPALSLNRGFSAPIVLKTEISVEERGYLAAKDPDPFNRWEAMQQLATEASLEKIDNPAKKWPSVIIKAFRTNIEDSLVTPAFRAALLTIPSEDYLSEQLPVIDPLAVRRVRESLVRYLADHCSSALWDLYDSHLRNVPYSPNATDAGRRALQNVALTYITLGLGALEPGVAQFHAANNMTDRLASLSLLNQMPGEARDEALLLFAERYDDEALVMDKWFSLQATAPLPNAASHVRQMMTHPRFSLSNPNKVRALIGAFAASNPVGFHAVDGSGYSFVAEQIKILNGLNPQLASRLVGPLGRWRRYDGVRRVLMRGALEDIAATPNLARDLVEVVNKSLAD